MAYSVDWIAKVVTVPTADLTLVSGTRYKLLMSSFLKEIRRLEWDSSQGLWAPAIVQHSDTRLDFAGADYAPFDEMINGYTWQVSGAATRVDLIGSNNNLIDTLIETGVSIVPSNSAGLQLVTIVSGSGLDANEKDQLKTLYQDAGYDAANPVDITDTSKTVAGKTVSITQPDANTTRLQST